MQRYKKRLKKLKRRVEKQVASKTFGTYYARFALATLAVTSAWWAWIDAGVQFVNADQIINPLLMRDVASLQDAVLPSAHTFLLKFPFFGLVRLFGLNAAAYQAISTLLVVVTVLGFAYILHRLDPRPVRFATYCLGLASVLLLVFAQPYAGGLLPVNMAMITTRNIEYLCYIGALLCIARSTNIRSRSSLIAVALLVVLFASDRLFMGMSILGALAALLAYAALHQWRLVAFALQWLYVSLASAAAAIVVVALAGLTGVRFAGDGASPYGLVRSVHELAVNGLYAVLHVATNFGANPAFDATTLRNIPKTALSNLTSPAMLGFVIHIAALVYVVYTAARFMHAHSKGYTNTSRKASESVLFALALLWSLAAAVAQFVATKHDSVVDARYLTISLFALVVAYAASQRNKKLRPKYYVAAGAAFTLIIAGSLFFHAHVSQQQTAAFQNITQRNQRIAALTASHKIPLLVGDYWRVIPIQTVETARRVTVLPLENCTEPRASLTSRAWRIEPNKPFAYILTLERGIAGSPACDLGDIVHTYGLPTSTEIIAGTQDKPIELLLLYPRGAHPMPEKKNIKQSLSVLPVPLASLSGIACDDAPTLVNVVAHHDDDLLFTSPDLLRAISEKQCVRTVYVTAGDAGQDYKYVVARERGAQTAYARMLGVPNQWTQQVVTLPDGQFVRVSTPVATSQVSLVFMRLADGNLRGEGFASTDSQSLAKLWSGRIPHMYTIGEQSRYSSRQLVRGLTNLLVAFKPTEIHTQSTLSQDGGIDDHSDHTAVGYLMQQAYQQFEQAQLARKVTVPIVYYEGYPVRANAPNVSEEDFMQKQAAFLEYAHFDQSVCQNAADCSESPTYGAYLQRQYRLDY